MNVIVNIGRRIQDRRKELKLSIEEIAKRLNKNRTTVYRYERGDIGNLPLETLKPLADILETTPAYLMGWEDKIIVNEIPENITSNRIDELIIMTESENFTDHEYDRLIEYASFLVYRRNIN